MLTPAVTQGSEFMPMADAGVRDAVDRLRGRGVDLEPGLTDPEVAAVESAHDFRFPPDLRRLLQFALPVSAGFPDWRSADPDRLRHFVLDLPGRGVLFDVEHNGLWPAGWGPRPHDATAARSGAERRLRDAPRLIPVYRHHYVPAGRDGPVLSARQGDIRHVAPDLDAYLLRLDPDDPPTGQDTESVAVPFWGDLVGAGRVVMPSFAIPRDDDPAVMFAPLRELAAARGVETQTGPGGNFPGRGWPGVWFSRPADDNSGRPRPLFGFFATAGGLLLNGCPGLSLVPDPDRLLSLCETLLQRWPDESGEGWGYPRLRLDADVREAFGLVGVANETCDLDVAWARGRERERTGWRELSDRRRNEIWDRYYATLTPPTGVLPPSVTWDISGIYLRPPAAFTALEADLTAKAFRALRTCTRPGERLYALDLNHPCYLFDPHHPGATADHESWPVPVLPNGDHYNFLAPDLRFGMIGNCVDQTICVFGRPLLDLLAGDPPPVFDRPTGTSEERAGLRVGWERLGWRQLTCDERDEHRDGFVERFEFRPARPPSEGSCFREPIPSIAWNISGLLAAGPGGDELRARFVVKLLAAFQQIIPPGGQVLAFDATRWFEHYSFDPHRLHGVGQDEWALPPIPDGCFSIFVAPDFSCGMVGNPVERTLCVFGRSLLDAVLGDPPPGLGAVLRSDGRALAPSHIVSADGSPP